MEPMRQYSKYILAEAGLIIPVPMIIPAMEILMKTVMPMERMLQPFKGDFGRSGFSNPCPACDRPIGVLFVVHGGMTTYEDQYMWDASVHQFSYYPNHSVYKFVIWNSSYWPLVLDTHLPISRLRFLRMYDFGYERIGGLDPFHGITDQQLLDIKANLDANDKGLTFEVDWAGYMAAAHPANYAYPRFIYYGPDGPDVGDNAYLLW